MKRLLVFALITGLVLSIVLGASAVSADSGTVTVNLLDSNNNGLAGGNVYYYQSGWQLLGTTDGSGTVSGTVPITTDIEIRYASGRYKWTGVDPSTNPTLTINTVLVTVELETCSGTPLIGEAKYYFGGWTTIGNTPATIELLPYSGLGPGQGSYDFQVKYEGRTSATIRQDISVNPIVVFKTTRVEFSYSGDIFYYNGGWKSFTNPMEMVGGPGKFADFKFGDIHNPTFTLDIEGCSVEKSAVTIKLLDSGGNGLAGGEAQYNLGGWQTAGTTDANGEVFVLIDGLQHTLAFRMYWEDTYTQKNQNVSVDSTVVFQTVLVQMELHASDGTTQLIGEGMVNSGSWKTMGLTPTATTDGGMELLPKTYAFRIYYEDTYIQKNQNVASDPVVVFDTVLVQMELHASDGTTQLIGEGMVNSGSWKTMGLTPTATTDGGMELLPKTYAFRIYYEDTYIQKNQNVASDPVVVFETTLVTMKLLDADDNELPGGSQVNSGGWIIFGSGTTTTTMELLPKTYAFRVYYEDTYIQKNQNVSTDPVVIFRGTAVTIQFSGNIEFNSGGWKTFTQPTMTLLPKTYAFRFSEPGYPTVTRNIQITGSEMELSVAYIMLLNSADNPLSGGEGQYNLGGWQSAGTTNSQGVALAVMEGLQNTLAFRMYYEDTYIQKNQNIASDSFVVFQTVLVKMELHSSLGAQLNGEGMVNSGSWKPLGTTPTAGMELLPKTYAFRIYYEDTYIEKNQNVATDQLVVFDTVLVKMELHSSTATQLTGEGQVNSGSWKTLGNTPTAGMELLPKTYAFRIYYGDTYIEKNQNVASNQLVVFDTVLVKMELHSSTATQLTGEGQVNSGSWKTLGNTPTAGMELLPRTYAFRIYYEDTYIQKNQNVATDQLVVFETVSVTVRLVDSGDGDLVGEAQVNSGGWKTLGNTPTTGKELLPQTYAFRVYYGGTYTQKNQNVASDPMVVFTE